MSGSKNLMFLKSDSYMKKLCGEIRERCVGSKGNIIATGFFAEQLRSFGFEVEMPRFNCFDWHDHGASLKVNGQSFEVFTCPYSTGGKLKGELYTISNLEQLKKADATGKIALLKGELANEQLMPKNFPFYNPQEHQEIIGLLESKGFIGIISATGVNPEIAGGISPFPLIEDGDFHLPAVYMKDVEGERLSAYDGQEVNMEVRAERIPSEGCNVVACKGEHKAPKLAFLAHIDSKQGTPGAIDNASGIVTLLLLGELLAGFKGSLQVEITAINGEDYYSNPGEQLYLKTIKDRFPEILLGINIDGVGYKNSKTAFSMYNLPPRLQETVKEVFSGYDQIIEGEPWYQGDHGLFLQKQIPALALTSEQTEEILKVAHTAADRPDLVDCSMLAELAEALSKLVSMLSNDNYAI